MNPLERRAVTPFHLGMMGLNAPEHVRSLWPALLSTGHSLGPDDICWLLGGASWRSVVMGAWFSTGFAADRVGHCLRRAMRDCQGSLTAPPLAVACVLVVGREAAEDLEHYLESPWACDGHSDFIRGALHHLTQDEELGARDSVLFPQLLEVGRRLQDALRN